MFTKKFHSTPDNCEKRESLAQQIFSRLQYMPHIILMFNVGVTFCIRKTTPLYLPVTTVRISTSCANNLLRHPFNPS